MLLYLLSRQILEIIRYHICFKLLQEKRENTSADIWDAEHKFSGVSDYDSEIMGKRCLNNGPFLHACWSVVWEWNTNATLSWKVIELS